jgi:peptidoglycan hydrolase-like protein with peptidoglycan-binding domain
MRQAAPAPFWRYLVRVTILGLFVSLLPPLALDAAPAAAKQSAIKPKAVKPATVKPTPAKRRPIRPSRRASAKRQPSQLHPTAERYQEIQAALADKGFFEGPPSGVWDDRSVAALKRFERSQKLTEDGKIDSLSLIALGLGPRRNAAAVAPPNPPATVPVQESK